MTLCLRSSSWSSTAPDTQGTTAPSFSIFDLSIWVGPDLYFDDVDEGGVDTVPLHRSLLKFLLDQAEEGVDGGLIE